MIGTGVVRFRGCDSTGEWLDECYPGFKASACCNNFLKLLATGRRVWRRGPPSLAHQKEFHDVERAYLPLARDGKQIDMFMALYVFYRVTIDGAEYI